MNSDVTHTRGTRVDERAADTGSTTAQGKRQVRQGLYTVRIRHHADLLWQDVRHSLRTIQRTKPLSMAVVITLVVGVGMNAVVFSLFNALLFRPHVTKDPASFVQIYATLSGQWSRELHGPASLVTLEDYHVIRDGTHTLSDVTVARWASFVLDGDASTSLRGMFASCNYLSVHLAHPMRLGRGFVATDCTTPGGEPVVILAERTWQRLFGSDPGILGRTVRLNDRSLTVIGVAPDDATGGPIRAMVYVPLTMQPVLQGPVDYFREPPGRHAWLTMSGRLRPGRTHRDAQAELSALATAIDRLHPGQVSGLIVTNGALIQEPETGRRMPMLIAMCLGTTMLILLMVCANVTTLLLARAVARRHEMAVRVSLGGSRWALLRQLLTEMVLLGGCAGVISIALAYYASPRAAQALTDFPLLDTFGPDWKVFVFTFALAFIAGCVAGITPALETLRFSPGQVLKSGGRGDTGPVSARLRGTLLANQLSISLALLIAMGSIVRAQERLLRVTTDYDPQQTLVTHIDLPQAGYNGGTARRFYDQLLPSVDALPGVGAVALSSPPPFEGTSQRAITIEALPGPTVLAPVRAVSPGYFPITGLRLLEGRTFTDPEARSVGPVMPVVVSASFAKAFFPGVKALGGRIHFANDAAAEIVGIVSDTASIVPTERDALMIYQPISAASLGSLTMVMRFEGDASRMIAAIRPSVQAIDNRLLPRCETVGSTITREASRYGAVTKLAALPAGVAVFLSLVGVYGLTTFAAAHRTQEIGVRIACGARTHDILALFLQSLRRPFLIGVLGGTGVATVGILLLQRTGVLPELSLGDPLAFGVAVVLLLCMAVGATLVPALQAARKAPWSTLSQT